MTDDIKTLTLYIAPGCPHCPAMLEMAGDLVKQARLGKLEVVNIAAAESLARAAGIRSVPSFQQGDAVISGVLTRQQLLDWLDKSSQDSLTEAFNQAFADGQLDDIVDRVTQQPALLEHLLGMLADIETPMTSRIGISAAAEHFANSPVLSNQVETLCRLSSDDHASTRADIAHLLGLSGSEAALPCLKQLSKDAFEDVRDTALEAIESIREQHPTDAGKE